MRKRPRDDCPADSTAPALPQSANRPLDSSEAGDSTARKAKSSTMPSKPCPSPPESSDILEKELPPGTNAPLDPQEICDSVMQQAKTASRPLQASVISELEACPDPRLITEVPNYFVDGKISDDLLPPYLKGMKMDIEDSHLNCEQMNLLIYYACVLPPGREKLFSPDNVPGLVTQRLQVLLSH